VAILAVKGLVSVKERLHPVAALGNVPEAVDGIAEGARIEDRVIARRQSFDVDPEDDLRLRAGLDLKSRSLDGSFEIKEEPAVERLPALSRGS
jgi:hypothetical protein